MQWPRFSLKLLLAGVAALCVWLSWNASVVWQRERLLERLGREGLVVVPQQEVDEWLASGGRDTFPAEQGALLSQRVVDGPVFLPAQEGGVSPVWRLLGAEPVFAIEVGAQNDPAPFRRAFPEAKVIAADRAR